MASTPDTATQLRSALASRGIDPFTHTQRARQLAEETVTPVSYTHLTLPTILLV